ncbi:squalene/phytoene synthase family protein [Aestuariibius sp. 2305UL40-4]|uniref:squalene/phytoene synthase family protein n=1 Tax=Aestuariibius violaceus TaxID=3234132 RepID=UPI00345EA545
MSVAACAALVQKGDPDRFLAAMAAPVAARDVLFPLYAFNLEVARAPWVTSEPMLAEMRLQWWRDALAELAGNGPARSHEVVDALTFLDPDSAQCLDALIEARRWDAYKKPFADEAAFFAYLDATAGHLMWTAARALGAPPETEPQIRKLAHAAGLARFLQAIPALEGSGRIPLVDGRPEAITTLATRALEEMPRLRPLMRRFGAPAKGALTEAAQARPLLERAAKAPKSVADGTLALSPVQQRLRLLILP